MNEHTGFNLRTPMRSGYSRRYEAHMRTLETQTQERSVQREERGHGDGVSVVRSGRNRFRGPQTPPEQALKKFSRDALIAEFIATHGRRISKPSVWDRLRNTLLAFLHRSKPRTHRGVDPQGH